MTSISNHNVGRGLSSLDNPCWCSLSSSCPIYIFILAIYWKFSSGRELELSGTTGNFSNRRVANVMNLLGIDLFKPTCMFRER